MLLKAAGTGGQRLIHNLESWMSTLVGFEWIKLREKFRFNRAYTAEQRGFISMHLFPETGIMSKNLHCRK